MRTHNQAHDYFNFNCMASTVAIIIITCEWAWQNQCYLQNPFSVDYLQTAVVIDTHSFHTDKVASYIDGQICVPDDEFLDINHTLSCKTAHWPLLCLVLSVVYVVIRTTISPP